MATATTPAEIKAGIDFANGFILKEIRAEVPGMFEGRAEAELPKHRQQVVDLVTGVLAAALQARITEPDNAK